MLFIGINKGFFEFLSRKNINSFLDLHIAQFNGRLYAEKQSHSDLYQSSMSSKTYTAKGSLYE